MDWTLLLLGGAGLFAFTGLVLDDDDHDEPDRQPEPEPEPEPEGTLTNGLGGDFASGSDADSIVARGPADATVFFDGYSDFTRSMSGAAVAGASYDVDVGDDGDLTFTNVDTGEASDTLTGITEVFGGGGSDTITASGYQVYVDGQEGADFIDASDLTNGYVRGGAGDTIIGSDAGSSRPWDEHLTIFGAGFELKGGTSNEEIWLQGDAALKTTVDAGEGNDSIWVDSAGDASLAGGAGDDFITTNAYHNEGSLEDNLFNPGNYLIGGGEGDDQINFDGADTVTGGDGADEFFGVLQKGEVAEITDFDPRRDDLWLSVESFDPQPKLVEVNGNTEVQVDGQAIAVVNGQTSLSVGYRTVSDDGVDVLKDEEGNSIANLDDVDVVIELINPKNYFL